MSVCQKHVLNSIYFNKSSTELQVSVIMGKKDKNKKKGLGAEKTSMKTEKKASLKQKKMLAKIGEVRDCKLFIVQCL